MPGSNADRVLGPGPEPGGRIVVEAAQLNAIARQFNVEWRSVSRADRAVLEWPGRPVRKEEAIEAVRLAITAGGCVRRFRHRPDGIHAADSFRLRRHQSLLSRSLNTTAIVVVSPPRLTLTGEGMNPIDTQDQRPGRSEIVEAPVALTRLLPETVLRADDVRIARVRAAVLQNEVARSVDQIVGMQLRRPVAAGQPLRLADLTRPPLVQRGATVQIELAAAGLTVSGQAVALDAGAEGEKVRVQNLTSHAFLFAQVIGPGKVRITPDRLRRCPRLLRALIADWSINENPDAPPGWRSRRCWPAAARWTVCRRSGATRR